MNSSSCVDIFSSSGDSKSFHRDILCDTYLFFFLSSGDTMPCEDLVKLGQDCDLLIHEATMEDDLVKEAKLKYHSTVSQAIQMGQQMRSKFTLLTHFSQRYAAIPHLSQSEDDLRNVGIAYDNMQVSLSQLPLLPLMYPTLKLMFNKHYVELEERAAKRQRLTNQ